MRVAITDVPSRFQDYASWIQCEDSLVVFERLVVGSDPRKVLDTVDALILPGGEDVEPVHYGRADAAHLCQCNPKRDALEYAALELALKREIPILGICRGMQLVNVFLGGTLVPDLLTLRIDTHTRTGQEDRVHPVQVERDSILFQQVGQDHGVVNSSHHQSVETVGQTLRIVSRSPDGVVEAVEWRDPVGKSPMILVQWHPERMPDKASAFAMAPKQAFLNHIQRSQ